MAISTFPHLVDSRILAESHRPHRSMLADCCNRRTTVAIDVVQRCYVFEADFSGAKHDDPLRSAATPVCNRQVDPARSSKRSQSQRQSDNSMKRDVYLRKFTIFE